MPKGIPKPKVETVPCGCSATRPKSSPPVYCSCKNQVPKGEALCNSCANGRHVY